MESHNGDPQQLTIQRGYIGHYNIPRCSDLGRRIAYITLVHLINITKLPAHIPHTLDSRFWTACSPS